MPPHKRRGVQVSPSHFPSELWSPPSPWSALSPVSYSPTIRGSPDATLSQSPCSSQHGTSLERKQSPFFVTCEAPLKFYQKQHFVKKFTKRNSPKDFSPFDENATSSNSPSGDALPPTQQLAFKHGLMPHCPKKLSSRPSPQPTAQAYCAIGDTLEPCSMIWDAPHLAPRPKTKRPGSPCRCSRLSASNNPAQSAWLPKLIVPAYPSAPHSCSKEREFPDHCRQTTSDHISRYNAQPYDKMQWYLPKKVLSPVRDKCKRVLVIPQDFKKRRLYMNRNGFGSSCPSPVDLDFTHFEAKFQLPPRLRSARHRPSKTRHTPWTLKKEKVKLLRYSSNESTPGSPAHNDSVRSQLPRKISAGTNISRMTSSGRRRDASSNLLYKLSDSIAILQSSKSSKPKRKVCANTYCSSPRGKTLVHFRPSYRPKTARWVARPRFKHLSPSRCCSPPLSIPTQYKDASSSAMNLVLTKKSETKLNTFLKFKKFVGNILVSYSFSYYFHGLEGS